MKILQLKDIQIGAKYWIFEARHDTRLLQVLVVDILPEKNRVVIDLPYLTETLIEVLPNQLYRTELEAINSVFRDNMYYDRDRIQEGYNKGSFDYLAKPQDKHTNRRVVEIKETPNANIPNSYIKLDIN